MCNVRSVQTAVVSLITPNCSQSNKWHTTGSRSAASDTVARGSLEIVSVASVGSSSSTGWLQGCLCTLVLRHRHLAWEIGRTVFADLFVQSILQRRTVQFEEDGSEVMWWDQSVLNTTAATFIQVKGYVAAAVDSQQQSRAWAASEGCLVADSPN